jgi:hypothetical protein
MDARARLLCYPRGSFYPLSSVAPMNHRRITKTCFRTCLCRRTRSQAGLCLYTFTTMSIGRKPTFVPLRYLLARIRPRQTDHLALSPKPYAGSTGKFCHIPKRGITLVPEGSLLFLTIKMHKTILNFSKAPRGLFVLVEVGRVFTAIAISPSKGSRQLLTRYAFRAGRNLPDKELRLFRVKRETNFVLFMLLTYQITLISTACFHADRTLSLRFC